ncbi:MAG: hypothetical protein WCF28_03345 [Methanobacterium sp.]|uniref:hypothetical protein n=1 Tax=Methanobacterium sp. TaxID=2164 RepID=UPI003C780396
MVNYESPERQEHQRILVHTTALIADCMNIEVWEDFFCINQLNKANYYKAKLEKFESDDNDETSIRDARINDLDLTISRLQALKLINK